ncbi:MAG TPA: hypothetical protein VNT26_02350, partial [Candidatus Sulfotelmatobacter sp.]|nr:hypothetical protein [Candidatus Sulfotelmatobacter sp.]
GINLVFNGDAECNSGTTNYTPNRGIAWWFDIGSTTLGKYGAQPQFPAPTAPGPPNRGANFFLGGTTNGSISQRIDLADIAADVDELGVDYVLSGWFGGAAAEADAASLSVRFLDAAGLVIGSNAVGNVTAGERANTTGLLERSVPGTLPPGTRLAELVLTNQVAIGMNDGSADNLSLVLTPKTVPPFSVLGQARIPAADGWRVEIASRLRWLYVLERSLDLEAWAQVTPPIAGSGQPMVLTDTNAPSSGAFYRVRCRWP